MFLSKKIFSAIPLRRTKAFCRGLRLIVFSILHANILWNSLQHIDDIVIGRYWDGALLSLV